MNIASITIIFCVIAVIIIVLLAYLLSFCMAVLTTRCIGLYTVSIKRFTFLFFVTGFSNENQILMENLYVKGYGANKLIKEYRNKGWELWALNNFFKKL